MIAHLFRSTPLPLALLALAGFSSSAAAGPIYATSAPSLVQDDEEELPDKRPEVAELLEQLLDHAGARGDEDRDAIALIDQATQEFAKSGPKDRKEIVKALDRVMKEKRKENEEGLPENRLHIAAATALGEMGPESVKPLTSWIGHKQHKGDMALQRQLVLSLGNTRDEDGVKPIVDLLQHHTPQMQAAAAESLANYTEAEEKVRKEIFEELLKILMRVRAIIDQDFENVIERERWEIISGPIMTTLTRLSGHEEYDAHEWQRWWNKNKKEDWDAQG